MQKRDTFKPLATATKMSGTLEKLKKKISYSEAFYIDMECRNIIEIDEQLGPNIERPYKNIGRVIRVLKRQEVNAELAYEYASYVLHNRKNVVSFIAFFKKVKLERERKIYEQKKKNYDRYQNALIQKRNEEARLEHERSQKIQSVKAVIDLILNLQTVLWPIYLILSR